MIYFDLNFFLGFFLVLFVLTIYIVEKIRPEIVTDTDSAVISLLAAYTWVFLLEGWKLDSFMISSQFILLLIILILEWENIRLRGFIITLKKIIKNIIN
uniref:Uncharacterized protein n=1 Tax=Nitzschia sp. PL3-2 TaxID=2083271 RepID=A0A2Z5ZAP1_9STRA|nr:hypothetical protein ycf66 [Nitzschia sp. PL3-2]